MRFLGNIIWLVFGGLPMAIGYAIAGVVNFLFIITIPFAVASWRLASYSLWPFGRTVAPKPTAGAPSVLGNIIWLLFGGIWLALTHLVTGVLLCLTIIGIPWGIVSFRLAHLALTPLGHEVVRV
jgi:uncharacterized membrane protein YccF (DUF307 family)